MSRRVYLTWVLAQCELTPSQRQALRQLVGQEPPGPEYDAQRGTDPTMLFHAAVVGFEDLPPVSKDHRACLVLEEDCTYVSIKGLGWVPLMPH